MHRQKETIGHAAPRRPAARRPSSKQSKPRKEHPSRGAGEPIRDLTPAPAAGRRIGRETSIKGGCPLPTMGMFDKAKEQAAKAAAATQVSQSVIIRA